MKKIIAILGDHFHDESTLKQSLNKAVHRLKAEEEHIRVEYIKIEQLVAKLQERPDAVILSKANKLNPTERNVEYWMDENLAIQICQYVHQGGGWLVWHSGLSSYERLECYNSMVKGKFDFHPREHLIVTYQYNESSDMLWKETDSFQVTDEHYFVTCEEGETNVFLHATSPKGKTVAGWKHEYGKGRVICLTPSHTKEGLLNLEFSKLLFMSLKWCCGMARIL
ncbi:ThuA domain-containing protein [Ectobacillus funiculus]|uniref:ThuA domain-containing protein n=1 Tax=Ectobacillus funiculus TaxID=137993 RepID=UPI00397906D9